MASSVGGAAPLVAAIHQENIQAQFDQILSEVSPDHFYSIENMRKLLAKYTPEELTLIYQDFCELKEATFEGATKALDYVVTAGGPGAGKSTVLELLVEKNESPDPSLKNGKRAYIDPDRSCLLKMKHTYQNDLLLRRRDPQAAYEHWREASNFLSNVFLAIALKEGYAIAHGSTMATPYAKNALDAIKNFYGYRTTIIHMTCDEAVRQQSETLRRQGGVVQCTDQDFQEKNRMFFFLLGDYLNHSDKTLFCYRGKYDQSVWAAKVENGQWMIYDEAALSEIEKIHDAAQGPGFWKASIPKS